MGEGAAWSDDATRSSRGRRPRRRRTALFAGLAGLVTTVAMVTVSILPADAAALSGVDVSHYQGSINWKSVRKDGVEFAFIKATEGTNYVDPSFQDNYPAARDAGVVRGAYHFARPDASGGAAQADYLYQNGGKWTADGLTLPAALDIEYNPYGSSCYGLSPKAMVGWITDFLGRYQALSGRYAVIYTTADWWKTCTGNHNGFSNNHPLWLARYASSRGSLPDGWGFHTVWQYTSSGKIGGISGGVDRNYFNGNRSRLAALANNTR